MSSSEGPIVLVLTPTLPSGREPGSMAPTARQIRSLEELGVETRVVELSGIPKFKYLVALFRMWREVPGVDLIHAHYGYCGWLARLQPFRPVVVSFMGDDLLGTIGANSELTPFSRCMARVNRVLARWVSAVIVKSPEMAETLGGTRARVIPNGVDTEVFRAVPREVAQRALGWSPGVKRILFPGNPADPRKGYDLYKRALRAARARLDGEIEEVVLWGVAPDQVATYMNACDAMLMASIHEGSPNVVKEALACDLPTVSVPVGDVAAILDDAPGHSVVTRDPDELAEALVDALRRPRPDRGQWVIERDRLGIRAVAERVLGVYDELLSRSG